MCKNRGLVTEQQIDMALALWNQVRRVRLEHKVDCACRFCEHDVTLILSGVPGVLALEERSRER